MTRRLIALGALSLFLLTGCQQEQAGGMVRLDGDDSQQVARINGQIVTLEMLEAFANARGRSIEHPEERRKALGDLINLIAGADAAAQSGVTQDRDLAYQLMIGQLTTITNAGIDQYIAANPPSQEDLMAEFQTEVARAGGNEFHLLHLVYADSDSAQAAQQALIDGAPFNDLVNELREAGVTSRIGDLGWVNVTQLPTPLADAVREMQAGQMSQAPIKSEYGWHLVVVMNVRPLTPPEFETVEEGIRTTLTSKLAKTFVDQARAKAEVLIFSD